MEISGEQVMNAADNIDICHYPAFTVCSNDLQYSLPISSLVNISMENRKVLANPGKYSKFAVIDNELVPVLILKQTTALQRWT
jgi:hypothetical protein